MVEELELFLKSHDAGRYTRDHFDKYCKKEKLCLSIPTIHIAGSNGKGSTARFLEAIYLAQGYKVGAFIKPSFVCVNESIRLNGEEIDDQTLARLYKDESKAIAKYDLSAFEATVGIAYRYFEEKRPDIVIIEAGMGGGVDATNIDEMDTILSIITSISLEHTAYLGTTVSQIAYSKSGIIKEEKPILIGQLEDEAKNIVREYAEDMDAPFYEVDSFHFDQVLPDGYHFDYRPFKDLSVSTFSRYQLKNASIAIEATKILAETFPVSEEAVRKGLRCTLLPGRFEQVGNLIFDGAHNPEATKELVASLNRVRGGKRVHVLFASMRDKNIAVMLPELNRDFDHIILTTFDHPRARKEEDYFLYLGDYEFLSDPKKALEDLIHQFPDDLILITGSLAFVGFLRRFYVK